MFKSDGTPIRDPAKYVEKLGSKYRGDLVDASGKVIKDPTNFVRKRKLDHDDSGDAVMFKDGVPIRDPRKYVAKLNMSEYKGDLVDSEGDVIEDPKAFVAALGPKKARRNSTPDPAAVKAGFSLFKASDGSAIRDPKKYVANMDITSYSFDLMDAAGNIVQNPETFADALAAPRSDELTSNFRAAGKAAMFRQDGTPIRDPVAYVARLGDGPYSLDLIDADGNVIEDPKAFVSRLGVPSKKTPRATTPGRSDKMLYKADGTPVRDPARYVAGMTGAPYTGGLFNHKGEEIRDPEAYVKKMGGASAPGTPRGGRALTGLLGSHSTMLPLLAALVKDSKASKALFKADGTLIKDPIKYVEGMSRKPGGYKGDLFNAKGQQIKDPVAYVKGFQK